ncbi:MAG: 2-oxoglutarate dehydrogenase E1 component [Chthoniobacterales bacterium]
MKSSFTSRWNQALLDENYDRWSKNPKSVDADWAAFFEGFELGFAKSKKNGVAETTATSSSVSATDAAFQTHVDALINAYRSLGHTMAQVDPLCEEATSNPLLSLEALGFSESDLDREVSSINYKGGQALKLRDLIAQLQQVYCQTIGVEYMHIQNPVIREWVRDRIETRDTAARQEASLHRDLLSWIYRSETFESFIHTKYVGSKRFSLEGGESLILALATVLDNCETHGIKEIVMGMAHRGRLNVLANFLNKPLSVIFNEFSDDYTPEHTGGSGDVKYHLGYQTTHKTPSGHTVEVCLTANPSHLEAVNPVVEGKARARQRVLKDTAERKKVLPLLIHGDAAFAGQGVVAEVLNMSQLPGYRTGGTLHIIINNQIGFTTLPADARSTLYCTDIAKIVDAPIFHVNGDDPIAVITVSKMAIDFRQQFGCDVVIDIVCYRRQGHNEGEEPAFTQPNLYAKIKSHPLISEKFKKEVLALGTVTETEVEDIRKKVLSQMDAALAEVKEKAKEKSANGKAAFAGSTAIFQKPYAHDIVDTKITKGVLEKIVRTLTTVPEGFRVLPKVKRIFIDRRLKTWEAGGPYDWAYAESLAFGSLLLENTPVRLSGQDSRRGTFSQRMSVFYDEKTRERYIPLSHLDDKQPNFCVYNSLLSEAAVLGFDYGYSMDYPSMLCLWEAQFGDFSNGAQVIIDQFIASAESKWQRPSSIVMLLPHGYEGQGPEHSSARLERFLQLCAEDNMQVCNLTTPAQYFHALRRQIHRNTRKPLIIMTPKSLLRSEQAVSTTEDFTNSHFKEILEGPAPKNADKVNRIILCSGKVYYDLLTYRTENKLDDSTALLRVEQIYPLHEEELMRLVKQYKNAKSFVWCQEEPQNMGAWTFIEPYLRRLLGQDVAYSGREASASPAVGAQSIHKKQQAELVSNAFKV